MKFSTLIVLAAAGAALSLPSHAANFAAAVVQYVPGAGVDSRFTNDSRVLLGAPSAVNPFGEATDPFNPPYGTNQVLSIGEGGSVTIKFARAVHNHQRQPHGLDFIIFGNTGFIITNDFDPNTFAYIGEPATDGSLFGSNPGQTRVSVSRDGVHFYVLDATLAPAVDQWFPSDGDGNPAAAVDPNLTAASFAGQTLAGIRSLYHGSAGGAGYNIDWARTRRGRRLHLSFIRYVRVEVISGKADVDAFSATTRRR